MKSTNWLAAHLIALAITVCTAWIVAAAVFDPFFWWLGIPTILLTVSAWVALYYKLPVE